MSKKNKIKSERKGKHGKKMKIKIINFFNICPLLKFDRNMMIEHSKILKC